MPMRTSKLYDAPYHTSARLIYEGLEEKLYIHLDDPMLIKTLHEDESTWMIYAALRKCIRANQLQIFEMIINEFNIDIQHENNILVEFAAYHHRDHIIEYLINSGVDINVDHGKIIKICCVNDAPASLLNFLIENKADIHIDDDCPLRCCVHNNHACNTQVLLDANANVHADNNYSLTYSVKHGMYKMVQLLLDNNADIRANNENLLSHAIALHDIPMITLLLNNGANLSVLQNRMKINTTHNQIIKLLEDHNFSSTQIVSLLEYERPNTFHQTTYNIPQKY
jgi:hypothetical protein